jgi:ribose-phosphate pyrophosphokinase
MQLNLILDTCRRSGVEKITVVMPYYPYARSDKKDAPRCAIGSKVVARMLELTHINNLVSVDLHAGQLQGHIDSGFHNLYMIRYICDYIYNNYLKFYPETEWNNHFVLIAPDAGAAKAVKKYSKLLGINNVIMDKERDYSNPGTVLRSRYTGSVEDFKDKTGIIIDDMIDTMGTMCSAASTLVKDGLKDVIVFASHGVLSGPAIKNINESDHIKEVIVTDTLPQQHNVAKSPKINILSSAEIIARTIDGIITGRSISRLFDKKEKE